MSTELMQFGFEGHDIRIEVGVDGEIMLIAADVCDVLGISDTSQAVARLDDDEKGTCKVRTPGGVQELLAVTESGFYTLTIRSNKPQAKPFRRWVTHEVLPQIRKTGRYETTRPTLTTNQILLQMMQGIVKQEQELAEHEERLKRLEASQGSDTGYITMIAYCKLRGVKAPLSDLQQMGKDASKRAKELGLRLGSAPDERFGRVNTYPIDFLDELFFPQSKQLGMDLTPEQNEPKQLDFPDPKDW